MERLTKNLISVLKPKTGISATLRKQKYFSPIHFNFALHTWEGLQNLFKLFPNVRKINLKVAKFNPKNITKRFFNPIIIIPSLSKPSYYNILSSLITKHHLLRLGFNVPK